MEVFNKNRTVIPCGGKKPAATLCDISRATKNIPWEPALRYVHYCTYTFSKQSNHSFSGYLDFNWGTNSIPLDPLQPVASSSCYQLQMHQFQWKCIYSGNVLEILDVMDVLDMLDVLEVWRQQVGIPTRVPWREPYHADYQVPGLQFDRASSPSHSIMPHQLIDLCDPVARNCLLLMVGIRPKNPACGGALFVNDVYNHGFINEISFIGRNQEYSF